MQTFWQDLRYGMRMLTKSPGFTAIAVLTLALGIGANSSIFSLINAVLLRPLPFKDPDRLVMVWERRASSNDANLPISGHEFANWQEQARDFEGLAMIQGDSFNLTGAGEPVTINALRVSADFFSVLGVPPVTGRTFASGEDGGGGSQIVVLNEKLWKSRFGADPEIVGQAITLNNQGYLVIGVMPPLDLSPDVWVPIDLAGEVQKVGKHSHQVVGRLKPGVTLAQAQATLEQLAHQLEQQSPNSNTGHGVQAIPLHDNTTGAVRGALLVLFGAVGFVLLIACANVANLLLTRAAARQKEIAIRTALGASRWRVMRQLLTESLLLAAMGGGVGLLLALWIIDLLPKIRAVNIPRMEQISLDSRVLIVTLGIALLTGIITGLAPAWRSSRPDLRQVLNEGTRGSSGLHRRRLGSLLVIFEVALALILLIGGGLMIKSFVRLVNVDPGFNAHNVLRLDLSLPGPRYQRPQQQKQFYAQLIDGIKTLPGVESVGATTQTPLSPGDNWSPVTIEGQPAPPPGQQASAAVRAVSNDYFRTMQIPLRKGRFFTDGDARIALPVMRWFDQQPYPAHYDDPQPIPTIIINETMARKFWPGEDPLGRRLKIIASPWLTVVGVVGDVRHTGLNTPPNPEMYLSHLQEPQGSMAVMVKTSGDPLTLATAVREQVALIDKEQPLTVTTMEDIFSASVAGPRFNTLLLGIFGALALLLAVVACLASSIIQSHSARMKSASASRWALGAATSSNWWSARA